MIAELNNVPMLSFILEEVDSDGRILNQSMIFAHDEDDALSRHTSMYPCVEDQEHTSTYRVFPHVQLVAAVAPVSAI